MTKSAQTQPDTLTERLRKRAEIRRQIPTRKSVQEGQPDRISDLLEEAASALDEIRIILIVAERDEEITKFDLIDQLSPIFKKI
ncbi:MAG TPA: hypothetical protein PK317_00315 [Coprothermobacter proteolyticus]|nr:hypothetical protein [Coprothermobacter proteolyticus]